MENCKCNCKILKSQENGVSAFREKTLRLSNGNMAVQNKDFISSRQRAPLLNFIKKNGGQIVKREDYLKFSHDFPVLTQELVLSLIESLTM